MPYRNSMGSVYFVRMREGKFVISPPPDKETGEVKQEEIATEFFDVVIKSMKVVDDEYEKRKFKKIVIELEDFEIRHPKRYFLTLRMDSGYGIAFCMMLPNLDLSLIMNIKASSKEIEGKSKTSLFIYQQNNWVLWFYTKDNPRDLPSLRLVSFKGSERWDNELQQEFLIKMIETRNRHIERLDGERGLVSRTVTDSPVPQNDDLPF